MCRLLTYTKNYLELTNCDSVSITIVRIEIPKAVICMNYEQKWPSSGTMYFEPIQEILNRISEKNIPLGQTVHNLAILSK